MLDIESYFSKASPEDVDLLLRRMALRCDDALDLRADAGGEHWITLHGSRGFNEHGDATYRHVLIDSSGRIIGGSLPKSAQGKHITDWWKKSSTPEPKLHEHLRGHSIAFTHHEPGHVTTGHGMQYGKNKWGKDEASPGHVKINKSKWTDKYYALESAFIDKDRLKALGAKFGPQLGDQFPKQWYIPKAKLPNVLKEMGHAEVSAGVVHDYEEWAKAAGTFPPEIKQVEKASTGQSAKRPFDMPAGMKREAMKGGDLYPYQKEGVQFLLDSKRAILGHGVGLGKTIQAITAARTAQQAGGAGTFLILCPSSRKYGWRDEIEKFSDATSVVLDASMSPKNQAEAWAKAEAERPDFIITNYETLQKPEIADKLHSIAPNVIADEAHKVKNYKAKTTKGFQRWGDAKYAWMLTATPFPNGAPEEAFTMINHAAPGSLGKYQKFLDDFAVTQRVKTPFGIVNKPIKLKNVAQLKEKVSKVLQVKQMTDPDIGLQLPDRRRIDVSLDMDKAQHRLYSSIRDDLITELSSMSDSDFSSSAAQVLVKMKRLEQVALDPDLVRPAAERTGDLSPKESWAVETISQHLEEPGNRGIVIFCDSKLPLEKISKSLGSQGINSRYITGDQKPEHRQETERMFGKGESKVILATSAAEEGMNLQLGGHTLIHLDTPWVPKSITQREGRVHRQGQTSPFTTHFHTGTQGTIEKEKESILGRKAEEIDKLMGTATSADFAIGKSMSRKEVLQLLGGEQKSGKARADSCDLYDAEDYGHDDNARADANLIQPDPQDTDAQILRKAIQAELDAVDLYEKQAEECKRKDVKKVLLEVAGDEKKHVGSFQSMLVEVDPSQSDANWEGGVEAREAIHARADAIPDSSCHKIEIMVRDPDTQLIAMLKVIQKLAAPGHGFPVMVDPDMAKQEGGKQKFYFDGDGGFAIKNIKVNGTDLEKIMKVRKDATGPSFCAGILFRAPGPKFLLVENKSINQWVEPGGHLEAGETPDEAANREAREEIGDFPAGEQVFAGTTQSKSKDGELVEFTCYIQDVPEEFEPDIDSDEISAAGWFSVGELPENTHPEVKRLVGLFSGNELEVAEAIQDGELPSPQKHENIWLFDIRIFGTGVAYRKKHKEFVVRDSEVWLTDEIVDRCKGLPVIFQHPKSDILDTDEFLERVVGSVMLPYIKGDEVWGVARINDESAAVLMQTTHTSTSPGVKAQGQSGKLESGESILIEESPKYIDHIAICEAGVWDKGHAPSGISLNEFDERADSD